MKIMMIIDDENIRNTLVNHLQPRGFEFIIYTNPIKAMDNIDEISPGVIMISGEDFPRHWKPFMRLLRGNRTKEETVVILLVGDHFPVEEAAKAAFLQVNGIIDGDLADKRKLVHIEGLLNRYKMINDVRKGQRYIPDNYDELEFMFTHPETLKLITGVIEDISSEGVGFTPDSPHLAADLEPEDSIPFCSLRIGNEILSVSSTIVRNGKNMAFAFSDLDDTNKAKLQTYFDNRSARELDHLHTHENSLT